MNIERSKNTLTRREIITRYLDEFAIDYDDINYLPPLSENTPLSVVIPAYNEGSIIENLLQALDKQKVKSNFEVIVVDNGSTDATPKIVQKFAQHSKYPLYHLSELELGAGCARKTGIDTVIRRVYGRDGKNLKKHMVAATDADTIPGETWLQNVTDAFVRIESAVAISGTYHAHPGSDHRIQETLGLKSFLSRPALLAGFIANTMGRTKIRGPNFALEIECYARAGGFTQPKDNFGNTLPGECFDLTKRVYSAGYPIFHLDYSIVASQRKLLHELISGINPQATVNTTLSRFHPVRDLETKLLDYALKNIPQDSWSNFMNNKLSEIIEGALYYSLRDRQIDILNINKILPASVAREFIRDCSEYDSEEVILLWKPILLRELEAKLGFI